VTNLEYIRSLSDIELSNFLNEITSNCHDFGRGFGEDVCVGCYLKDFCEEDNVLSWMNKERTEP
jgi:hypothetical protein